MNCSIFITAILFFIYGFSVCREKKQRPKDCSSDPKVVLNSSSTVEDLECCAPYLLETRARLYFQSGAGKEWTLRENQKAYERLQILPRMLRDVSKIDLSWSVLNHKISMPIAAAPSAYHKLASNLGEIDTVRAVSRSRTLMVLSSLSTTSIEDVAQAAPHALKWMQLYIFPDRRLTLRIIKRAEAAGFRAIAVTVDAPIFGPLPINAVVALQGSPKNLSAVNTEPYGANVDASITFDDLKWVKNNTRLPVIAKGILTPEDAIRAARCGVSAIWVSNHGGRQLDYVPATIDALPKIVRVMERLYPKIEIYVDGGIRNGYSAFKALALGAHVVFVGRPVLWGLAAGGEEGVKKVFDILRKELNTTMTLAGTPNVRCISKDMIDRLCGCPDNSS